MTEREQMLIFIKDALEESAEGQNRKELAERLARCIDAWTLTVQIAARRGQHMATLAEDR